MARHAGRGNIVGPRSTAYAPAPGEAASAGPTREAVAATAVTLLRQAAAALVLTKLRLAGIPTPDVSAASSSAALSWPAMMADVTRCEAQVVLAMAQVARSRNQVDEPGHAWSIWRDRVGAALARCGGVGWQLRDVGEQLRLARMVFVAVLLCAAVAVLWVATTLDLTRVGVACAVVAAVLGAIGVWRAISARVPRSLTVVVNPEKTL